MPKKNTNENLTRIITLGFNGLEKSLMGVYRGDAGLIEALRLEMHARFDRLEKTVQADHSDCNKKIEQLKRNR